MNPKGRDLAVAVVVGACALVLLFWNLGTVYLWQDESAAAVLGQRLMRYGRPLGWDGRNLITMDVPPADFVEVAPSVSSGPEVAVRYFVANGDFREDTTWIGQPWGQFVVAGLSIAAFGRTTVAARAPFALASVVTVLLLFLFARRLFRRTATGAIAAVLLLANPFWVLHGRQCRYYALSSLFLLATVALWTRWQRGDRFGLAAFIACAWCWFQCDFGSFWPGTLVLLAAAAFPRGRPLREVALAAASLAGLVAPFVVYYRLLGRLKIPWESFPVRLAGNLYNMNQYVLPLALLAIASGIVALRWRAMPREQARAVTAGLAILAVTPVWVTVVAPWHFHRYVVATTPIACLVASWLVVRTGDALGRSRAGALAASLVLFGFVVVSPLPSNVLTWAIPGDDGERLDRGLLVRPELAILLREVFGERPDPNREAIELVRGRARPGDEVLVNYEDIPFMFYTDLRVRGGIPLFRVRDDRPPPPRFLVFRSSAWFVYGPVFSEAAERYRWSPLPTVSPDVPWGNNPDPSAYAVASRDASSSIVVATRLEIP